MPWITHLLALINALVTDRSRLALENIALRQQIVVRKCSVKPAKLEDSDRVFWILIRRLLDNWRDTLLIVKPETVIQWHHKGWRYFCRPCSVCACRRPAARTLRRRAPVLQSMPQ